MRELRLQTYKDKVLGGWIGKCLGGNIGAPFEGWKAEHAYRDFDALPKEKFANDDLDIQLLWLHTLRRRGLDIDAIDLAEDWLAHNDFPWSEYKVARRNFACGIWPPESGSTGNWYFSESMGCPIRSEIWGFIAPGAPGVAAEYARKDATLDHAGFSVDAEMFLAALEAEVFFETNLRKAIRSAASVLKPSSQMREMAEWMLDGRETASDPRRMKSAILNRYYSPDMTDARVNLAIIVGSLLVTGAELEQALLFALNMGYDSDCTCASVGAILGVLRGASNLPPAAVEMVRGDLLVSEAIQGIEVPATLDDLAEQTVRIGCEVVNERLAGDVRLTETADQPQPIEHPLAGLPKASLEYAEECCIAADETRNATLRIRNPRSERLTVTLSSEELTLSSPVPIPLETAEDHIAIPLTVAYREGLTQFNCAATLRLRIEADGNLLLQRQFGFLHSPAWKLLGPFFRERDARKIPASEYPDHDDPETTLPSLIYMTGNRPSLETDFLSEDVVRRLPRLPEYVDCNVDEISSQGKPYTVRRFYLADEDIVMRGNRIMTGRIKSMKGNVVYYLYTEIELDAERDAYLDFQNTTGAEAFVNGECVYRCHEFRRLSPVMHDPKVRLRQGRNRLLLKLANSCEPTYFDLVECEGRHMHQHHFLTDFRWVRPQWRGLD